MRTTTRAGLITATLIGIAAPALTLTAPAVALTAESTAESTAGPTTVHERGIVLECAGTLRGQEVHAEVYENDTYGNTVVVVIGDLDAGGAAGHRDTKASLWSGTQVKARVKVDGRRATVSGDARKVGRKKAVHDEFDDGGQHVVADGFHRRVRHDLSLTYAKQTVPLTCETAFFYDLQVTKEDIA